MNKQRARQLYELADRLSKVDVASLSEQQLADRNSMIAKLQEEVKGVAEGLPQTLRKVVPGYAKREIDKKMDAGKFGKTDADKDANFNRYKKIQDKLKEQGVTEDVNGEYDDEAGMAQSNLHTMARAVNGLLDTIKDNDNLPEWAQEKLAKAEMMVTSVWDYLLSQKEQGIEPKVTESKKPSPKLTPVDLKKTDPVSEEINTEAYERLQKVFAFKNYES